MGSFMHLLNLNEELKDSLEEKESQQNGPNHQIIKLTGKKGLLAKGKDELYRM
jgi:hypothetical protein